jgi:hypothetical protein
MTDKKYVLEHNCETGETVEREFTAEEYAQAELDATDLAQAEADRVASQEALATLKASAKAKLIAGEPLTAEEADTLVI